MPIVENGSNEERLLIILTLGQVLLDADYFLIPEPILYIQQVARFRCGTYST